MCLCLNLTLRVGESSTTSSSAISNQLEAGSIIVRHMKSISVPSLPRSMYGPIKSTHTASQGVIVTILVGSFPYFYERLLFTCWATPTWICQECSPSPTMDRPCPPSDRPEYNATVSYTYQRPKTAIAIYTAHKLTSTAFLHLLLFNSQS
jgi:hypothetical protein